MADKTDNESAASIPIPDRPLECSECRRPIRIRYSEVIGEIITDTSMCAECPQLQKRLHGIAPTHAAATAIEGSTAGLACGACGTTLEAIRVGTPLGCSACYDVFADLLIIEMLSANKISPRLAQVKKSDLMHIGRVQGEVQEMSPSLRLLALNEALTETLKKEDYEQAALLRDQIKALERKEKDDGDDAGK